MAVTIRHLNLLLRTSYLAGMNYSPRRETQDSISSQCVSRWNCGLTIEFEQLHPRVITPDTIIVAVAVDDEAFRPNILDT